MITNTHLRLRSSRRLPTLLLAAGAVAVSAGSAAGALSAVPASAAQVPTAPATCPATFQVLHDDHIGQLAVPKGTYTLAPQGLTCARAANRLAAFLQDFDGRLPTPWTLDTTTATFQRGTTGAGFSIARTAPQPTPTPGGGTAPAGGQCPGSFQVEHDDRIGALRLPAGPYRMTIAASGRPTCAKGARLLARFLDRPDGKLPRAWTLNATTGSFAKANGAGFRIKPVKAT